MNYYTLHCFVAFVFFVPSESFLPVQLAQISHIYIAGEIATKAIESVQVKQQRAAVSQKAVETKQLSPMQIDRRVVWHTH